MLPTTGFFKNIDCPFYEISCDRPYCHFKHRKKTQEPQQTVEILTANTQPTEVPTYNPTPKSQLVRSHIPISYVPDLATVRKDRNFRSSAYGYSGGGGSGSKCGSKKNSFASASADNKQPTYKPTPLSVLSSNSNSTTVKSSVNLNYSNDDDSNVVTFYSSGDEEGQERRVGKNVTIEGSHDNLEKEVEEKTEKEYDENNEINFEDLENEFNMIDELISDSGVEVINGENEKISKKYNGSSSGNKIKESKSQKSSKSNDSKDKHRSHSSSSSNSQKNKKESKTKEEKGKDKDNKESKEKKSSSSSSKKSDSKHGTKKDGDSKSSRKSSSTSKDDKKRRSRSRSKSKERQKDSKTSSSTKDKKHESSSSSKGDKVKEKSKQKHKDHRDHHKESNLKHSHKTKRTKERGERDKVDKNNEKEKKKSKESNKTIEEELEQQQQQTNEFDFDNDVTMGEDFNIEEEIEEEEDEDEDPLAECYKIFTEYKPTEPELFPELKHPELINNLNDFNENKSVLSFSKKRIAHGNADKLQSANKITFNKPKYVPTAAQTMVNRIKAVRLAQANNEQNNIIAEIKQHIQLKRPSDTPITTTPIIHTSTNNHMSATVPKIKIPKTTSSLPKISSSSFYSSSIKPSTSTSLVDDIISGKSTSSSASSNKPRRIAPVQNVDSIQRAKAKLQEMAKLRAVNATKNKTQSHTLTKGAKRTAHVPESSTALDIPDVLEAERSKLPVNVRTRFLTMILEECVKLYLSNEEAQQRALTEEYKCYERCAVLLTYRNSAMLAINRLRKEIQEREIQGLGPIFPGEVADSAKGSESDLRGRKLYEHIKRFILSDDELVLHGYPREGSTPGRAVVKNQKHAPNKSYLDEDDRICCRCLKVYKVDDDGFALHDQECLYHPLKKRTFRGESIYLCCRSSEETGCVTAATHVCESDNTVDGEIEGYQTTMPPERKDDPRSCEVFALDCEMCYTTRGLELTRVTIVNSELKTVYESLVKPLNAIVDYNTRFSGITEEQMNRTATSILQVQANILHLCNSNTILIGHSLESDMKALKIIHNTIIDTSVLFPHKFGLPHKRALRDLARDYLKKIIQNDISGHDSAEDALTCMELIQWKVKEELKARGIKT